MSAAAMLYVICGHGAGDPGSSGGGKNEADLVRQLAARMKVLGGGSVEVLDTSKNWYAQKLVNSTLKSKVGGNPVIELHMDWSESNSAKGGHVIIDADLSADGYDNALADYISKKFPGRDDKLVKRNNLANLNRAQAQGINYRLLECCFISNTGDREMFIADMDEVAAGILGAFGIGGGAASSPQQTPQAPQAPAQPQQKEESVYKFRTVKKGAKGDHVRLFQAAYNERFGGSLAVDGSAGPATHGAIGDAQQRLGIAKDYSCGPDTWAHLLGN